MISVPITRRAPRSAGCDARSRVLAGIAPGRTTRARLALDFRVEDAGTGARTRWNDGVARGREARVFHSRGPGNDERASTGVPGHV
jgi:hypothetical protein